MKIDAQLGTDEDFTKLAEDVHGRNMHLVLDGVFNHIGRRNTEFVKARSGDHPDRAEWFFLGEEYGELGYKCWSCAPNLVELRLEVPSCQEYIYKGANSVMASWLKKGADGWRLDVASEIGYHFLKEMTECSHKHKDGCLIVGEVWAFPSKWNKALDGTLSLHSGQVLKGVANGDCNGWTAAWSIQKLIEDSSIEAVLKTWIVLSNHDMPRLANAVPDLKSRQVAVALQFTIPGSPLLYYGDELGMDGDDDPMNRATMEWELVESGGNGMFDFMKKILDAHRRLRALRIGDYTALPAAKLMAFMRTTDRVEETVVVLANGTAEPVKEMVVVVNADILGHTQIVDELTGEKTRILGATICEEVPAKSVKIYSLLKDTSPSEMQYKRIYGHWATLDTCKPFP
jgi:glycosidase